MLLDSYAWIEFFIKSKKGEKVKAILKEHKCFTSIVSLAEVTKWALDQKLDSTKFIKLILELSEIINLTNEISVLAGRMNFELRKNIRDWGMVDSFIYASAIIYDLKIVTGDEHFRNLNNTVML